VEKKSKYNEDTEIDLNACSVTDCTGLIPSIPQSEAERESYEDLFHYRAKAHADGKSETSN